MSITIVLSWHCSGGPLIWTRTVSSRQLSQNTSLRIFQYQECWFGSKKIYDGANRPPFENRSALLYRPLPFGKELFVSVKVRKAMNQCGSQKCTRLMMRKACLYSKHLGAAVPISRQFSMVISRKTEDQKKSNHWPKAIIEQLHFSLDLRHEGVFGKNLDGLWKGLTSHATPQDFGVDPASIFHPDKEFEDRCYSIRGGYIRDFEVRPKGLELSADYWAKQIKIVSIVAYASKKKATHRMGVITRKRKNGCEIPDLFCLIKLGCFD